MTLIFFSATLNRVNKHKKRNTIIYILLAIFLLLVIYILLILSRGSTSFFGRASGTGVFNPGNSYVFASPLLARVNGDQIRVTVFVLDGTGAGIVNKQVLVGCLNEKACQEAGMTFSEVQGQTNKMGQAIFDLSSRVPGKFELQATVGGTPIPQTVTVSFQ